MTETQINVSFGRITENVSASNVQSKVSFCLRFTGENLQAKNFYLATLNPTDKTANTTVISDYVFRLLY